MPTVYIKLEIDDNADIRKVNNIFAALHQDTHDFLLNPRNTGLKNLDIYEEKYGCKYAYSLRVEANEHLKR